MVWVNDLSWPSIEWKLRLLKTYMAYKNAYQVLYEIVGLDFVEAPEHLKINGGTDVCLYGHRSNSSHVEVGIADCETQHKTTICRK